MALDNLSGQRIRDTFQRLVQHESGEFADGSGNKIKIITSNETGSFAYKSAISGAFADASHSLQSRLSSAESELNNTLVSGSAQIASEISGAFYNASSSISARLVTLESTEEHIHTGTVSGSVQIASEISGAFTDASHSLQSRIVVNEAKVGYTDAAVTTVIHSANIISGSVQIASEISGAFNTVSHSLQSRLSSAESELNNTLVSGSAQIATEISGAFNAVSHSLQSRITTNKTNITSLISATSSYLLNTTDTLVGNLTVTGKITAEEFHTEFVTSSVIFASGSSRIGNTSDDNHQFTGSVFISGSGIQLNGVDLLPFTSTAISQSLGSNASVIRSLTRTSISQSLGSNASVIRSLTKNGISGSFTEVSTSLSTRIVSLESTTANRIFGQITASNISASGTINADQGRIKGDLIVSNIISGSGPLYFSASLNSSTDLKTLMYDAGTGRIYHTGSYGGGGGSGTGAGFPFEGNAVITGSLTVSGSTVTQDVTLFADVIPGNDDEYTLGTSTKKWNAVFATNTFFGGIHEINLETTGISQLQTGTVLVSKAGQMVPCDTKGDALVMGVASTGSDYPVVMGAEPVLVDGAVYEGDYIITSNRIGYGMAIPPDKIYEQQLFGKIIAQSLETNLSGGSIKAMIRKM